MSVVTTIVLLTSILESNEVDRVDTYPAIDSINAALGAEWLKPVHGGAGGNKYPQAEVFMAAINHFDIDILLRAMRVAPWQQPEVVRLLVNGEYDDGFEDVYWQTPHVIDAAPGWRTGTLIGGCIDPKVIDGDAGAELPAPWQPIDTAPKDGTPFLAKLRPTGDGETVMIVARWSGEEGERWVFAWGEWSDDTYDVEPTHWTPLPLR